uniref:Uncharacterized protein n=1 Tax=Chromera velia CCMP2878 TaxID=1169474 RepID=A0A0G4ID03_9ALVE|eukprot:Cvel_13185.t1-p1 / transcript=Cvel_13185.t1 / gene=Cvel_13185 / organism=Chromera_velia_CCMP2878 / gene_product=hypothetical protein / transcript_product=hypothetical protein / location=Cvel_scaffold891:13998-22133(-) / protein_length=181 / sequence_SO=supercontig / SO=protein_coding / is_pseudo=false
MLLDQSTYIEGMVKEVSEEAKKPLTEKDLLLPETAETDMSLQEQQQKNMGCLRHGTTSATVSYDRCEVSEERSLDYNHSAPHPGNQHPTPPRPAKARTKNTETSDEDEFELSETEEDEFELSETEEDGEYEEDSSQDEHQEVSVELEQGQAGSEGTVEDRRVKQVSVEFEQGKAGVPAMLC